MPNNVVVSVIIINWNGQKDLSGCLTSLKKVKDVEFEVILVDNGSTDQSAKVAQKIFPDVHVIRNQHNLGYAPANNQGLAGARGEFILFLNNDTKVTDDFLKILVSILKADPKIAAVQPKIYLMGRGQMLDAVGSFLTWTGFLDHFGYERRDGPQYAKPREIFSAKGACMLFRKSVLDQIGNFDNLFFAYFEETDLCWRAWLAGYRVSYVPQAVIYHKGGATAHRLPEAISLYHSYKNRIRTFIKNFAVVNLVRVLFVHSLICTFLVLAHLLMGRTSQALAIVRAYWWNITVLSDTLQERTRVQALRQVGDKQLFGPLVRHKGLVQYLKEVYFSFFIAPKIRQEKMGW
ncbi:glycosyltransferase [Candidatus Daviesbacteria bacterium]|nr:glycosyltransferase [Candidatus Daviesbacteria bacterium]